MQVTVETTQGLERKVKVEVPEDRVQGEVSKRLTNIAQSARLPGFRPGKAPMKVIAQRYGKQVREEVVGEIVQSSFQDAIVQESLRPAGTPTIDPLEWEAGGGVAYTAIFDVYPEVSLPAIDSLRIAKPEAAVSDADLDGMLDRLRKQRRGWDPVQRAAMPGDRVVIDFEGVCDGEVRDDLKSEGFAVELGAQQLFKEFEEGLMGAQADQELSLDLHFPSDFRAGELAGKPVSFQVKVNAVEAAVLPTIDDAFAESFGVKEGGIEQFKSEVRANMQRELEEGVRTATKQRVMEALLAGRSLELPESLIKREVERSMGQRRLELTHSGMSADDIELDPQLFDEPARRRVSLGLLVGELIKENAIKADPEEIRARIDGIASTYEDPDEVVRWYYSDPTRLSEVESSVLEDTVVAWIMERAEVVTESSSFDELLNPGQTQTG
ncbi:MAG: trigger factor [Gammaproteobacteria bacterium]|nr:trigger factor [Gammaproteobacteria bacterium]MDX2462086.1 trigger factor [Gammaproteobacteria bacterium]